MTKAEQAKYNKIAYEHFEEACRELKGDIESGDVICKRLRTCQAWVYETQNYYLLKSYDTLIACIRKDNDTMCDVLRTEYGYTSTSCQHIAKFRKDYGHGRWGCEFTFIAR